MLSKLYSKLFCAEGVKFVCPICHYSGLFIEMNGAEGRRKNARCPKCGALERHRLHYLIFEQIFKKNNTKEMKLLHFAPDQCLQSYLKNKFGVYVTADLSARAVDRKEDLTQLTFKDDSFDMVYASHVLEHIKNDRLALAEIKRVLKPGGCAIIPVPIIGETTLEFQEPDPRDSYHVRRPGNDYYERYKNCFSKIELYESDQFNEKYQTWAYEPHCKARRGVRSMGLPEIRHADKVPVCYK